MISLEILPGGVPATTRPFRFTAQFLTADSGEEFLACARRVESQGYSTLNIADHFNFALSPIPASMAAALVTTKLRVGSLCMERLAGR